MLSPLPRIPWILSVLSLFAFDATATAAPSQDTAAHDSIARSLTYLRRVMDQFHDRFPVYDDVSSAGNHFHAWAKIPNAAAAVSISGASTQAPHTGATAIRAEFHNTTGLNFGGFYFLNGLLRAGQTAPSENFGEAPNAGIDLTGANALSFWARGEVGGERIEFFMGGVGRNSQSGQPTAPFPDSTPVVRRIVTLGSTWQRYVIDLTGKDLSYVLGGFGWLASADFNPTGAVFYIDDIQYELEPSTRATRLNQPRLLKSFSTHAVQSLPPPVGDFDFVFRNGATTYDNALALLAFLADGSPDSVRRARLIGDAFLYAIDHDRTYNGDRLRDVYAAGDLALPPGWAPNGRTGTVPVPGFFDEATQTFVEIEQGGLSTGNNAWAMIALLALYRTTGDSRYLDTAERLAQFIHGFKQDTGAYRGFLGGLDDPEGASPRPRPWASTEHNLDLYAAFTALYELTAEPQWQAAAAHALDFVEAMWEVERGCILTGTIDPGTRNQLQDQLPSDTQSWSVLAVPEMLALHPGILGCAEHHHRTQDQGFTGFDFNDDRDGVWFEGTAHLAVAYAAAGQDTAAESLRSELRRAQETPPFGDDSGLAAASREGLTTGFNFFFFRRLHVGATAWNVFAQARFNPFTARSLPGEPCSPGPEVLCLLDGRFAIEVDWRNQHAGGTEGQGIAVQGTDKSGYFWFFNPVNIELIVKALDGRSVNGRFWIFWGALSDVEYTIRVTDTVSGDRRTYHNDPGDICGGADTSAFPTASPAAGPRVPEVVGSPWSVFPLTVPSAPPTHQSSPASAPCSPGPQALCLADGRFRVTVHWRNQHANGTEGEGNATPYTGTSGFFWFFNEANVELIVKILDGRTINGRFWVFYGALSDVEYDITVTDTATGLSKTYHNDPGNICGNADTGAFLGENLPITQAKLKAGDAGTGDRLGWSVSVASDTALVGAILAENACPGTVDCISGAAYIFEKDSATWHQAARLTAPNAANGDRLGVAVSLSGDTALVGDSGDADRAGSAYVFERIGAAWVLRAKLTAPDATLRDEFGAAVAVSGDTAVIGARFDDDDGRDSGSAYVFQRSPSGWTQVAKLTAPDLEDFDHFGWSVAIQDDTLVVGARSDNAGVTDSGAAFIFVRDISGWSLQKKLVASDRAIRDYFGWSVAIYGSTVVVGAPFRDVRGATDAGAVYVFERSGTTWAEIATLTAGDAAPRDEFGTSVGLGADTILVGAPNDDDDGSLSGSAYIFRRTGATWTPRAKLVAEDAAGGDSFGYSVAVFGATALVGSRYEDRPLDSGAAYVFDGVD